MVVLFSLVVPSVVERRVVGMVSTLAPCRSSTGIRTRVPTIYEMVHETKHRCNNQMVGKEEDNHEDREVDRETEERHDELGVRVDHSRCQKGK